MTTISTAAGQVACCAAPAAHDPVADSPLDLMDVLRAVADPLRWRIVTLLAGAELCTTHLQDLLDSRQNLISHHLRVLREAGVVLTAPCGRFTYYRLRPGVFDALGAAVADLAAASHADLPRRPC